MNSQGMTDVVRVHHPRTMNICHDPIDSLTADVDWLVKSILISRLWDGGGGGQLTHYGN